MPAVGEQLEGAVLARAKWLWRSGVSLSILSALCSTSLAADLLVGMPNWPSGQAAANIIKYGIEEKLGLKVDVQEMGTLTIFAGLDTGEVDMHPEVWRPNFDSLVKKYVDEKKTVQTEPQGGGCNARHLRDAQRPRTSTASRTLSDLNDPKKAAVLRYRRRRARRNVDRRADLVFDEHRADSRQQLWLCENHEAAGNAGGRGDGGRRCRRGDQRADRVLLLQPAPRLQASRHRSVDRAATRRRQMEGRPADRGSSSGCRSPVRRWHGPRRSSTSGSRPSWPSGCRKWRRSFPTSTSRRTRSRR